MYIYTFSRRSENRVLRETLRGTDVNGLSRGACMDVDEFPCTTVSTSTCIEPNTVKLTQIDNQSICVYVHIHYTRHESRVIRRVRRVRRRRCVRSRSRFFPLRSLAGEDNNQVTTSWSKRSDDETNYIRASAETDCFAFWQHAAKRLWPAVKRRRRRREV